MSSYSFRPAVIDPNNWVYRYITYARECTDAPHDYHEAHAFALLSLATQGLRADLATHPGGLATNLYLLILGQSSLMRKSTAMDIAAEIQDRALPGSRMSENFTPGGLEEEMAERSDKPSVIYSDEFTGIIEKMHHNPFMAGLRPFLLTMYKGGNWKYTRRAKAGKKDEISISNGHLSVVGNITPAISKRLTESDVTDGFLARFGIVAPIGKPNRQRLFDIKQLDRSRRADVWTELERIRHMALDAKEHPPNVDFEGEALKVIDDFQGALETKQKRMDDTAIVMTERLGDMAIKCAMLVAAGRPNGFRTSRLWVTFQDTSQAVELMWKWMGWAVDFAGTLSHSKMDGYIKRVIRWLEEHGGEAPRWDVCRRLGFDKRMADDVQLTMIDHDLIKVRETETVNGAKPRLIWILNPDRICENEIVRVEAIGDGTNGGGDLRPVLRDGVGGDDDGRSLRSEPAGGGEVPEVPW